LSQETATHNLDVLGIDLKNVEAMVLLRPGAWRDRKIVFPSGTEIHMPPPSRKLLEDEEVQVLEERGPTLLLNGSVLVSGQVERVTSFEKGFPFQQATTARGNRTLGYGMIKASYATCRGGAWSWFQAVAIPGLSMFSGTLNGSQVSRRFTDSSEVFT